MQNSIKCLLYSDNKRAQEGCNASRTTGTAAGLSGITAGSCHTEMPSASDKCIAVQETHYMRWLRKLFGKYWSSSFSRREHKKLSFLTMLYLSVSQKHFLPPFQTFQQGQTDQPTCSHCLQTGFFMHSNSSVQYHPWGWHTLPHATFHHSFPSDLPETLNLIFLLLPNLTGTLQYRKSQELKSSPSENKAKGVYLKVAGWWNL